jgi:hypothetical protein
MAGDAPLQNLGNPYLHKRSSDAAVKRPLEEVRKMSTEISVESNRKADRKKEVTTKNIQLHGFHFEIQEDVESDMTSDSNNASAIQEPSIALNSPTKPAVDAVPRRREGEGRSGVAVTVAAVEASGDVASSRTPTDKQGGHSVNGFKIGNKIGRFNIVSVSPLDAKESNNNVIVLKTAASTLTPTSIAARAPVPPTASVDIVPPAKLPLPVDVMKGSALPLPVPVPVPVPVPLPSGSEGSGSTSVLLPGIRESATEIFEGYHTQRSPVTSHPTSVAGEVEEAKHKRNYSLSSHRSTESATFSVIENLDDDPVHATLSPSYSCSVSMEGKTSNSFTTEQNSVLFLLDDLTKRVKREMLSQSSLKAENETLRQEKIDLLNALTQVRKQNELLMAENFRLCQSIASREVEKRKKKLHK